MVFPCRLRGGQEHRASQEGLTGRKGARPDAAERRVKTSRRSDGIRLLTTFLVAVAVVPAASVTPSHHPHHHRDNSHNPGCQTARCDKRVGRRWWRQHHHTPAFHMTRFEICVANHESGAPEDPYNPAHINWRYRGDYEGAYNWVNSTWLAEGGGRYAQHAYDATPKQQVLIFRAHENPRDWPVTVPACGG